MNPLRRSSVTYRRKAEDEYSPESRSSPFAEDAVLGGFFVFFFSLCHRRSFLHAKATLQGSFVLALAKASFLAEASTAR